MGVREGLKWPSYLRPDAIQPVREELLTPIWRLLFGYCLLTLCQDGWFRNWSEISKFYLDKVCRLHLGSQNFPKKCSDSSWLSYFGGPILSGLADAADQAFTQLLFLFCLKKQQFYLRMHILSSTCIKKILNHFQEFHPAFETIW